MPTSATFSSTTDQALQSVPRTSGRCWSGEGRRQREAARHASAIYQLRSAPASFQLAADFGQPLPIDEAHFRVEAGSATSRPRALSFFFYARIPAGTTIRHHLPTDFSGGQTVVGAGEFFAKLKAWDFSDHVVDGDGSRKLGVRPPVMSFIARRGDNLHASLAATLAIGRPVAIEASAGGAGIARGSFR